MKGKFNYYCVKFGSQGSVPATPSGMLQPDTQRKSGRQRYHTISCRSSPPPSLAAILCNSYYHTNLLFCCHDFTLSISSHKRALAMERKHTSFGIGGGEDGAE